MFGGLLPGSAQLVFGLAQSLSGHGELQPPRSVQRKMKGNVSVWICVLAMSTSDDLGWLRMMFTDDK